jgi:integrase
VKNALPIDLAALERRGAELSVSVLSLNSRKARAADWKLFSEWCIEAGKIPLPAEASTLCLYVTHALARGNSCNTVSRRICTVSSVHKDRDLPSPVALSVWRIIRGARRDSTRPKSRGPKLALSSADLAAISGALGLQTYRDVRDRCILVFGFHSALRRAELSQLDVSDLTFSEAGVTVFIRRSKRDQESRGTKLGIFAGANATTCPVRVLEEWLKLRGEWNGPLFVAVKPRADREDNVIVRNRSSAVAKARWKEASGCESIEILYQRMLNQLQPGPPISRGSLTKKRLCPQGIADVVKRGVKLIGGDPAKYGGHSLRSGMVTAALDSGEDALQVMQRTRHTSMVTLAKYFRPSIFSHNPLKNSGL